MATEINHTEFYKRDIKGFWEMLLFRSDKEGKDILKRVAFDLKIKVALLNLGGIN